MVSPKVVEALRGLARFAVGASVVLVSLVSLVDLAGVGRPDCRDGKITLASTLALIAMTWAIPAVPGITAVLLLRKAAREPAGATVALLLGAVTVLAALLVLAMNVFATFC